jgi:hypothetical protein
MANKNPAGWAGGVFSVEASHGRSRMILDLVIEARNPADSDPLLPMLACHVAFYGQPPRQGRPMAASPRAIS